MQIAQTSEIPTREKQAVALSSVFAALILTVSKGWIGWWTGSLGILSEAAHSALDLLAAGLTYVSVRFSDRPADSTHHFGHGKVENLSAFLQTGLLLVTCIWIIFEAVRRLFFHEVEIQPSLWAFGIMFISITIDTFRSRALFRVARKYDSQALEADALHFQTDVWSSSVVVLGLVLVSLAGEWNLAWLRHADPVAALVVAGIVIHVGVRLGKRTVDALVDAAPKGVTSRIALVSGEVPGVVAAERVRARQSGGRLFVDLKLRLASNIPLEHAQSVADRGESAVHTAFPNSDVTIHPEAHTPPPEDLIEKNLSVAHRHNFQVHDVTAHSIGGTVHVDLDLEVEPSLTLERAHEEATRLEESLLDAVPAVGSVTVHIEPRPRVVEPGREALEELPKIERKILQIARQSEGVHDCHSVTASRVGESVLVSLHCTMDGNLPIAQVHDITEQLKLRFRSAFPRIQRVNIHAEPAGQSQPAPPDGLHK